MYMTQGDTIGRAGKTGSADCSEGLVRGPDSVPSLPLQGGAGFEVVA